MRSISDVRARLFADADERWNRKRRKLGYDPLSPTVTAQTGALARGESLWAAYVIGIWIARVIIFFGCWVYCTATYGFLLGVGLGWLPSGIAAYLTAWLWPIALIGIFALIGLVTIVPMLK